MQTIRDWFVRHMNDPQVMGLAIVLVLGFVTVVYLGDLLAPALAALVIAYLLEGMVLPMTRRGVPRLLAVLVVFLLFVAVLVLLIFTIMPTILRQFSQLLEQLPIIFDAMQRSIKELLERYPGVFSDADVNQVMRVVREELLIWGQGVLGLFSVRSVVAMVTALVFLILVPFMVFFFLKDKDKLLGWLSFYLPAERRLAREVWLDVNRQIANYVRGKFLEILIVWVVSYVTFLFFDLQFALLLSMAVGLSVIIPYVGAAVVTVPVALVGYFQFGLSSEFLWLMVAYGVIQALDGNLLVPLLFSEAVNLHPVAIIIAILLFGGIWGFWGVFFAIPLATLIRAVVKAWPREAGTARVPEEESATAP